MTRLRSLAFNLLFFGWTAILLVVGLPVLLLRHRHVLAYGRFWARTTLALLAGLVGLRHRVTGADNLPTGPLIVAVKHQSSWETLACMLLFREPAYVLKRELLRIPIFGWYLLAAGMIAIDRVGGGGALRTMLRRAAAAAAEGRTIVIYPEGTRTAPGERRPYQSGVAALYERLGLPVTPVALNSGLFWGRRSFAKRAGTITVEILPPIAPGLPRREFLLRLETEIEGAMARLDREVGAVAS